jgi:flavin reductase (DIM6/NTAB) family NADH-FMN oxidoreductase RutF
MSKNTPPNSSFFPIPSALVTYRSFAGKPQMRTTAWVGMIGSDPPRVTLAFRPGGRGPWESRLHKEFAVNLPPETFLSASDFLSALALREGDGAFSPGLSLVEAMFVDVPLIKECPVRIECVRGTVRTRFGQRLLSGEVAVVHAGDSLLFEERLPVDPTRFQLLMRAWRKYLGPRRDHSALPLA